ncbi:MAG: UDPglucose 6-dehydrogenase [Parcubacteria group bacterium Athens0714_16]|nr:MAG: UDPglucose 6-dehydrogenase [Parcubacteria group bacterium Athens0714_16]
MKYTQKIGFMGQGYIGKNYSDDFENRGFSVVRYSVEEVHKHNKEKIKECDIVFIAVPAPTTPKGFDDSIIKEALKLVGKNKTAVIKSTIPVGKTEELQKKNKNIFVFHSPEFLTEATASHDAAYPDRNIVGMPVWNDTYKKRADEVMNILPKSPYNLICNSRDAELIKYGGNCLSYAKIIFVNIFYDLVVNSGANWETVKEAISADPRIGKYHIDPIHKTGRGAGGHCFIKDFAMLSKMYDEFVGNKYGKNVLKSLEEKNKHLLTKTKKDLDLLQGVYGRAKSKKRKKYQKN